MTDVTTGQRARKIRAHRGIINTLDRTIAGGPGAELIATGSDDGTVKIWEGGDEGSKQAVATFSVGCPVTGVCWSIDGANVYVAALDNEIHVSLVFLLSAEVRILSLGLRRAQSRTTLHSHGPRRHPDFAHAISERVVPAFPLLLIADYHP